MKLSDVLAVRCITVKLAALDPDAARDEFESLGSKERVARGMADRFSNIAKDRATEEADRSPLETATDRLWPVPHTGTEAAIRLPLVGAGGYAGYQAAKGMELPDATGLRDMVARVVKETPAKVPAEPSLSRMGTSLKNRFTQRNTPNSQEIAQHLESLIGGKPEQLAQWIHEPTSAPAELGKHFGGNVQTALDELAAEHSRQGYHFNKNPVYDPQRAGSSKYILAKGSDRPPINLKKPGKPVQDATKELADMWSLPKAVAKGETAGAAPQALSPLGQRLLDRLSQSGHGDAPGAVRTVERVLANDPKGGVRALSHTPDLIAGDAARGARGQIESAVGRNGTKLVGEEVRHMLHKLPATTAQQWKRYGAAGLGIAGASVLTGLPLALNAVYQRRHGGEAAVRAKKRVKQELSTADQAASRRAQILKELAV